MTNDAVNLQLSTHQQDDSSKVSADGSQQPQRGKTRHRRTENSDKLELSRILGNASNNVADSSQKEPQNSSFSQLVQNQKHLKTTGFDKPDVQLVSQNQTRINSIGKK